MLALRKSLVLQRSSVAVRKATPEIPQFQTNPLLRIPFRMPRNRSFSSQWIKPITIYHTHRIMSLAPSM